MSNTADQEFLEFLIKSLVDHPDDVKVDRKVDEMGVLLSLRVHPSDMGHVVGRFRELSCRMVEPRPTTGARPSPRSSAPGSTLAYFNSQSWTSPRRLVVA